MRDWNAENYEYLSHFGGTGFDLTYEGLKFFFPVFKKLKFGVLILPMRDWNTLGVSSSFVSIDVLILPMRDWNKYKFNQFHISTPVFWSYLWGIEIWTNDWIMCWYISFDLTYEGLKFYRSSRTCDVSWCFDLTYEGLKCGIEKDHQRIWTRFDLTYEGLKYAV